MGKLIDLTHKTIGNWYVLKRTDTGKQPVMWLCRCSCGNIRKVNGDNLRYKKSTNCGCKQYKTISQLHTKHGMSDARVYVIWKNMKRRCYDLNSKSYKDYGGRGINVCERWLHSFDNFVADMGIPEPSLSLDRIDNNVGYSPDNCRWATVVQQSCNKRSNRYVTYNDITLPFSKWAKMIGRTASTIREYQENHNLSEQQVLQKYFTMQVNHK